MANLNRIILVGRLTADPEGRATLDGLPMTKFRLAVNRQSGMGSDSFQGGTDFIDVIAWRRLAEACGNQLKKGEMVLVEGRIQIRSFEDQAGQRRWATEVVAKDVRSFGAGDSKQGGENRQVVKAEEGAENLDLASDLPF